MIAHEATKAQRVEAELSRIILGAKRMALAMGCTFIVDPVRLNSLRGFVARQNGEFILSGCKPAEGCEKSPSSEVPF